MAIEEAASGKVEGGAAAGRTSISEPSTSIVIFVMEVSSRKKYAFDLADALG